MKNGGNGRSLQWRRFIVDMLIGASTIALAFALIDALTDSPYTLLLLAAATFVGIGLLVEPGGTTQPRAPAPERFDAPIVEAAAA